MGDPRSREFIQICSSQEHHFVLADIAVRLPPNRTSNSAAFGRDARDAKAWTAKGASFVALAATLLIAQKFREVVAELYPHKT